MQTKSEQLRSEFQKAKNLISELNKVKESEKQKEFSEKVTPLFNQANAMKKSVELAIEEKYKQEAERLNAEAYKVKILLDEELVKESKNVWHPDGTIVTLWKQSRWSNEWNKTDRKGTVKIYDGSQDIPNNTPSYRSPSNGDILIFHNKKDGTMGCKFEIISYGKNLKNYMPMWLAEGETIEDNLTKKIKENAN